MKAKGLLIPELEPPRNHPAQPKPRLPRRPSRAKTATVVARVDKRSWFVLAITGFGAVLLRYLRHVRQRAKAVRGK